MCVLDMHNKQVVIIVSNYNGVKAEYKGKPILFYSLSSLRKTSYKDYIVILADDKSTDNSIEYVKKNFAEVDIVVNKFNGGFSKNNNNAIRYAIKKYNPEYILLLNNDIIIDQKGWLLKLIKTLAANKKAGLEGCKLVYPNGRIQHAGLSISDNVPLLPPYNKLAGVMDNKRYNRVGYISGVTGAAILISKDVIDSIGLLDENFYMGHEDIDYCLRAIKAGFKIIYNGKVKLTHLEGFTSTNSPSPNVRLRMFYYFIKNFVYFRAKYKDKYSIKTYLISQLLLFGYIFFDYSNSVTNNHNSKRIKFRKDYRYFIYFIKGYLSGVKTYKALDTHF